MAISSPNMSLTEWTNPNDPFAHTQLAANWAAIDTHNHTTGKGVQIPSGGIAANAITSTQIATNAVGAAQISAGAVGTSEIAAGAVTGLAIANNAVNTSQIVAGAVGNAQLQSNAVRLSNMATGNNGMANGAFLVYFQNGVNFISQASPTPVFDTVAFDVSTAFNLGTTQYTPPQTGYYYLSATIIGTTTFIVNGVNFQLLMTDNNQFYFGDYWQNMGGSNGYAISISVNAVVLGNPSTPWTLQVLFGDGTTEIGQQNNPGSPDYYCYWSGHLIGLA